MTVRVSVNYHDPRWKRFNFTSYVSLLLSKIVQIHQMSINNFLGRKFTVTGGRYFRFFPYRLIRRIIADSDYTMTYFHPRDFDPKQPILEGLPLKRKFKSRRQTYTPSNF